MNTQEIETNARRIVDQIIDPPKRDYERSASFVDDFCADSFDAIEVVMKAEEVFDIEIEDADIEVMMTFGDFVDLIESKVGERISA